MDFGTTTYWFWFGFVGMLVGSAIIIIKSLKLREEHRYHALISLLVTTIATISYYALARGQAEIVVSGDVVYIGRYLDWLFTTPLLLLSLLVIGLPPVQDLKMKNERIALIASVLFANILMIMTGAFADLSSNTTDVVVWYTASCLWFLVVLWLMFGVVRKQVVASNNKAKSKAYINLLTFLSVIWVLYPVMWLLGSTGFNVISLINEAALFAIMDISAKAVFGILVINSVIKLNKKA